MKMTADVIIIGGGINGCAAAYYLAKRGITDVLVLEAEIALAMAVLPGMAVVSGSPAGM